MKNEHFPMRERGEGEGERTATRDAPGKARMRLGRKGAGVADASGTVHPPRPHFHPRSGVELKEPHYCSLPAVLTLVRADPWNPF